MSDIKNKHIRNFLRYLCAIVLIAYTGYIVYRKLAFGAVNIDETDKLILGGCIVIWVSVEAIRKYFVRKYENKQ